MTNNRAFLTACCHVMLLALVAPGIASAAPTAPASGEQAKPAAPAAAPVAATSEPGRVEGVTVNAPRAVPFGIPPDKAADLAAEAAKDAAFRAYRKSTPPLTNNPNDDSKDFPGLQAYVPK